MTPVLNKRDMYKRLTAGEFGNTNPAWFDYGKWRAYAKPAPMSLWGVRSLTANDPRTKLNVPAIGVLTHLVATGLDKDGYQISPMVRAWSVQWEGDITRMEDGLVCCGNVNIEPGSWREHMQHPREWRGSAAERLLRHVMNENSYDDLQILLDLYPSHVVECSCLNHCFGTIPGRNAVVWEVRLY